MSATVALRDETFAGNRALGRIAFDVAAGSGASRRRRLHEAGSLRVRFPNGSGTALDAVIVNTAGGMTGGDRFKIEIDVGCDAALTVTTAAAEKIYRSLGPDSEISVKLAVGSRGMLAWLPQETLLFDRVRLCRSIDVALQPGGNLLLAEALVFGRAAMGEAVAQGRLIDRWRVRIGGRLAFAETVRLDGFVTNWLARAGVARGGVAVASILKIPGADKEVAAVRAMAETFAGEVGISAWNGIAVVRLIAPEAAMLRRDLMALLPVLHEAPLPRLWLN